MTSPKRTTLGARKLETRRSKERVIILRSIFRAMQTVEEKRTMPVCFTPEQLKVVEEYAKKKGMLNASQAVEELTGN